MVRQSNDAPTAGVPPDETHRTRMHPRNSVSNALQPVDRGSGAGILALRSRVRLRSRLDGRSGKACGRQTKGQLLRTRSHPSNRRSHALASRGRGYQCSGCVDGVTRILLFLRPIANYRTPIAVTRANDRRCDRLMLKKVVRACLGWAGPNKFQIERLGE
jgi:hypothetical protein